MKKTGFTHDDAKNKSIDWYTPPWIFSRLGIHFDLDPCHPEKRIPWIPVTNTFNIKDDGLQQPWEGLVWLNPPYGKHTLQWVQRMDQHRNGVLLVFARTDCQWYQDYISQADAILFLKGRVKFIDGLNATGNQGAGCGSLLAAWGKKSKQAVMNMYDCGHLVVKNS